jgi:hypothetical protein
MNKIDRYNWETLKNMSKQERLDYLQTALLSKIDQSESDIATAQLAKAVIESMKLQEDERELFTNINGLGTVPEYDSGDLEAISNRDSHDDSQIP